MSIRLGLVALIWLVILGGTVLFMRGETPQATAQMPQVQTLDAPFSLEVTTTFPLETDPFALTVDEAPEAALQVTMGGNTLFAATEMPAGEPQTISDLPELIQGQNEFLVRATPPMDTTQNYAVRLQLLRAGQPLASKTFWAANGAPVVGALHVDLGAKRADHAE